MSAVMGRLRGRKAAEPIEDALNPEQIHPPLAEAVALGRQLADRGRELMAQLKPLQAERERLVTVHGERAQAAELEGHPLDTAALEEHEHRVEVLDRQIRRLAGQMDAVMKAVPQQEAAIAARRVEALPLAGERLRELAAPNVEELAAHLTGIVAVVRRDRELRDAAAETFEVLGQPTAWTGYLPRIMPAPWLRLNEQTIGEWERQMRASGFDLSEEK